MLLHKAYPNLTQSSNELNIGLGTKWLGLTIEMPICKGEGKAEWRGKTLLAGTGFYRQILFPGLVAGR
jgi:hypothetical protein